MLKLQKSMRKAPNVCENSVTENVAAANAKVDVDDELCPGELHYPETYPCFQCGIEYIPKNNMKGDEIEKHILCRRLLWGVKMWKIDPWTRNQCTDKLA